MINLLMKFILNYNFLEFKQTNQSFFATIFG